VPVTPHHEQVPDGVRHRSDTVPVFPGIRERIRGSVTTAVDADRRRQRLTQPTLMSSDERLEADERRHRTSFV
jgi:hypothetical protein